MQYKNRELQTQIEEAMTDTPVIAITGARQTGKSTLLHKIIQNGTSYVSLDDSTLLTLAKEDPHTLIQMYSTPVAIDEIQKAPELITAIKLHVDNNRKAGSFILTGSANLMTIPKLSESLSGRIELITLYPFTQAEINAVESTFLDKLVNNNFANPIARPVTQNDLIEIIIAGGYPEAIKRQGRRRNAWFKSYISTLIQKDVKEIFDIDKAVEFETLFRTIAALSSQTYKIETLAATTGLSRPTITKYINSLEGLYLITRIPAWYSNELKRLSKAPKIHIIDTGLAAHLRKLSAEKLVGDRNYLGNLTETLVATELIKLINNSADDYELYHYRSLDGDEVDFILTTFDGTNIGIEVKAGATYQKKWTKPLQKLIDLNLIAHGVVIYNGEHTFALASKITILSIGHLFC